MKLRAKKEIKMYNKKRRILIIFVSIAMLSMTFNVTFTVKEASAVDVPTGNSYMLYEHHGYTWVDAEKRWPSDGEGIGPNPGEEDDLLCWAATASNVMEWTGWGLVDGMWDTDAIFDEHKNYFNDTGSLTENSWHWWLNGFEPGPPLKLVTGGGNYWPGYTWTNYLHAEGDDAKVMQAIDDWLHAGYGVGIGIYNGGHVITVWGFNYDPNVDKTSNPQDYYLGIWVSDSDSDKKSPPYPDAPGRDYTNRLSYYEISWNNTANRWYLPSYGGWMIGEVKALEPFPSGRPVADADGPYVVDEGTAVTFDGSGSSDAEGDTINYRWEFDFDGDNYRWDTAWSSSATTSYTWNDDYSGDIVLQIVANQLLDIDTTTVTVNNVAPTITSLNGDTIYENDVATVSGTFDDPSSEDTFTVTIDWGEGSPVDYAYPAGSTSFSETHQYLDDNPTSTPSDVYTVMVTVEDDDGGSDTESITVTVNNVDPSVDAGGDQTINEGETVNLLGVLTDPGTLDTHTIIWDCDYFGQFATTLSTSQAYGDNGVFTVTLTVTDDDTGTDEDTMTVTVNNVDPTVTPITMALPYPDNPDFILPVVHTLTFKATATDPGSDDLTFTWDWNDTTYDTTTYLNDVLFDPDPYPSPEINPRTVTDTKDHIYAAPGTYNVTLTVEDDDGGITTTTFEVIVLDAAEAKEDINDYIQALSDDLFKGNANNRKNAFDNKFNALNYMLENEEYQGAINKLNNDIRSKCDGYIDGKKGNDWTKGDTSEGYNAQWHICNKIDDLTAYLATFL